MLAGAVLPLLAGVGVSPPVAAEAGPAVGTSGLVLQGLDGVEGSRLWGVAATGPDDALAVGRGGQSGEAKARRWDGVSWGQTNPPGGPISELYAATMISRTDAWATGNFQGRALANHWDGSSWTQVPTPPPEPNTEGEFLVAVDAAAGDDVWAVGETRLPCCSDTKPLVEHWDGESWSRVPYTLPYGNTLGLLLGITAISRTDAWAVGSTYGEQGATLLLHWDGYSWEPVTDILTTNSGAGLGLLTAVDAVSADDIWAVGVGRGPVLAHWDGRVWTRLRAPGKHTYEKLTGVAAVATDDVWAVGSYGDNPTPDHTRILHWDGDRWQRVRSPSPGTIENELNAVTATGPDDAWAVGSFTNSRGTFHLYLHWDGEKWTRVRPNGEHPD